MIIIKLKNFEIFKKYKKKFPQINIVNKKDQETHSQTK